MPDENAPNPIPPGFKLRHTLEGHERVVYRRDMDGVVHRKSLIRHVAWSPDGQTLAAGTDDGIVQLWDAATGQLRHTLGRVKAQAAGVAWSSPIVSVAWSPDGQTLTAVTADGSVKFWDVANKKVRRTLRWEIRGVISAAGSPDGRTLAAASSTGFIRLWDVEAGQFWDVDAGQFKTVLTAHVGLSYQITNLAWSPDSRMLAFSYPGELPWLLDVDTKKFQPPARAWYQVISAAWSPDGQTLAAGDSEGAIHLVDVARKNITRTLEGHTDIIKWLAFSLDGALLASKSGDGTVRLWRCDTGENVAVLDEPTSSSKFSGQAFHPQADVLATLGEEDTVIRIWELDFKVLLGTPAVARGVSYTTAKLVLVGDSGVGKTGLGWRLAHGEFKEQSSTHGQQFWPITQLGIKRADNTECEAVLWDLAGQHVYRQVHSIFLENVAAALVLFDPSNRQEPLKGVQFWLEQLKGKGQLPPAVLVGARVDRGAPALSQQELEQFCQRYDIRGGYISTSAMSGEGLEALLERLKAQIPWDEMTATVTTVTFKRIKDYVLALKEKPDREGVLVSPPALREQLQATDEDWRFTDAEMMTAVGHLETHGYVAVLRNSAGEQHILLTPDLLVTLASSIVLLADKNPRELGAVSETELLLGKYPFDELAGLAPAESQILLDAAVLRFLQHNICFRETLGNAGDETLLIFPALIKQKRPLQDDLPSTDDISYVVRGRVENLYASLVVLLGYTPSFTRINQWQNQAQYEMGADEICGFRLIEDREGEIELVLYYGDRMPAGGRDKFQELFEQFLYQRDVDVTRFPPVVCANKHQQKRATVIERVRERKPFMFCDECGDKITLPDFDKPQSIGIGASPWLQREEAAARLRSAYEVQLTRVKGYRRGWATPRCYVSRLPEQAAWAEKLVHDLRAAGVYVVEQATQVQPDDFVVVLDTPAYQRAYQSAAPALDADAPLISARLGREKPRLISLARSGQSAAHEFKDCTPLSFCDETHYPASLFNLVLYLYAIPLDHRSFEPLRRALHEQWAQTLAQKKGDDVTSPLKIFISYAHKDETFKDELVTMLAGLQRRGIVDAWQDRRIEAGDEWNKSIQDAMNDCDLALLLVSPTYLASGFIQEEEQPKLLQRRREMQLRVIPIIVRPCKWQSEPLLKDLQALPKDGKAVITFSDATGDRDQVWTDIATVIEQRAKAKTRP